MNQKDCILGVARARARVLRLKDEVTTAKANLKAAEAEFNTACRDLSDYAADQLKFDLGMPQ